MQKQPPSTTTSNREATPSSQETSHPIRTGTATAHDGAQIHFEVLGSTGPFVLLTHATAELGDRNAQRAYVDFLGKNYRLIFFDPGEPKLYTLTPASLARDYLAVADAAGADRFYYYGYSFGCVSGLQLALRTDRIIALACGGFPVLGGPYKEMLTLTRAMASGPIFMCDGPPIYLPELGRQQMTYYQGLQSFDDSKAQARLTIPRMILIGEDDVITLNGTLLTEFGSKVVKQRAELEALGWKVVSFPGKNHAAALASDVVAPVIKSFFDEHK